MMHLYVDQSGSFHVEIGEGAALAMLSMCEQATGMETGGILVGSYSVDGVVAHVGEALGPPRGSRATKTGFLRSTTGLRETLRRRWSARQHYLGEWHSHPGGGACPSPQDRRQLAEIGSDAAYVCQRPILVIVGGRGRERAFRVWLLRDGEVVQLKKAELPLEGHLSLMRGGREPQFE